MKTISATFLISAVNPSRWPKPEGRLEIAFCGRSNVGKSSLLNALIGRSIARVSQTPGRTTMLNFFEVVIEGPNKERRTLLLCDLPGFGYAKVGREERLSWRAHIEAYLSTRDPVVVVLADSRRAQDLSTNPDQLAEEVDLAHWLLEKGRQVLPVMTKADKLSKHERKPTAQALQKALSARPIIFSALDRVDRGEDQGENPGVTAIWDALWHAEQPGSRTQETNQMEELSP